MCSSDLHRTLDGLWHFAIYQFNADQPATAKQVRDAPGVALAVERDGGSFQVLVATSKGAVRVEHYPAATFPEADPWFNDVGLGLPACDLLTGSLLPGEDESAQFAIACGTQKPRLWVGRSPGNLSKTYPMVELPLNLAKLQIGRAHV